MNITYINHIYHPPVPDYDPLNLPRTVGCDEPLPAASELADRLMGATSESELRRIVWEAFRDLFIARDAEDYREAVYDTWKHHIR